MSVGGILSGVGQSIYRTVTTYPVTSVVVGVAGTTLAIGVTWNLKRGGKLPDRQPARSDKAKVEAIVAELLQGRPLPSSSSSSSSGVSSGEARPSLIDWRGEAPDPAKLESIRSNVAGFVGDLRVTDEEFQRERLAHFSALNFEALKGDLRGQPVSEGGLAVLDLIARLEKSPGTEIFSISSWTSPSRDPRLSCLLQPLVWRSGFERLAYLIKTELLPQAKGLLQELPDGDQKEVLRGYIAKMEFAVPVSLSAFVAMLDAKDESGQPFFSSYLKFLEVSSVHRPEWASEVCDVYRKAFNGEGMPILDYEYYLNGLPFSPFESAALTIRWLEAVATPRKRAAQPLRLAEQFQPLFQVAGGMRNLDEDHFDLLCQLSNPAKWAELRSSWYMQPGREASFSEAGRSLLASIQTLRQTPGSVPFTREPWVGQQMGRLPQVHPFFDALRDRSKLEGAKSRVREELLPEAAQLFTQLPEGGRKERLGALILEIDQAQKGTLAQFVQANSLLEAYHALLWEIRIDGTDQEKAAIPTRVLTTQKVVPSDLLAAASFNFDPYEGAELTVRVWEVMTKGLKETR